ncbi:hypothetical protein HYPSUDRAFT_72661 [Hypholoma sublateritium FD-334 SS-4]|uniref:Uncharacterized protein n=1 Tax=Hypholoma sublateritium (strain FD-334 SS-4) TaxID=945553 RepID=A0A0D2NCI5_HYPSF|nr:hypothetical protein HYPSUDRAFT_72661 [Hypholoma sublateritium FD-334 SS-4]
MSLHFPSSILRLHKQRAPAHRVSSAPRLSAHAAMVQCTLPIVSLMRHAAEPAAWKNRALVRVRALECRRLSPFRPPQPGDGEV